MAPTDEECRKGQVAAEESLKVKVGEIGQMSLAGADKLGVSAYQPNEAGVSLHGQGHSRADREREREREKERDRERDREGGANAIRKVTLNSLALDLDPASTLTPLLAGPNQAS